MLLTIFTKNSIVDVWLGCKYIFDISYMISRLSDLYGYSMFLYLTFY